MRFKLHKISMENFGHCQTCPRADYKCKDCKTLIHNLLLSRGPEKGRRPPVTDTHIIPIPKRVIRMGERWMECCDVYVGDAIICRPTGRLRIPESKWWNRFGDLAEYEAYVRSSSLWEELGELSGMTLGYTLGRDISHIPVLQRLFAEKFQLSLVV